MVNFAFSIFREVGTTDIIHVAVAAIRKNSRCEAYSATGA
ncbi:MAG: hypothetical protein RLZZ165_2471 [Bacteroidota bacterium]|jgi:hypothetical protein